MYLRRSATVKYFIASLLGAALYCEWFVYLLQPIYWQELKCAELDATCTRILFIADPQIQGEWAVPPPLNHLFNWDSDRYLKSTFSVAVKYFKPDVLVYLGDLMDEGSISTIPQFHGYAKRLSNIFEVDYPVVQLWIPGDNDIGGEGQEPVKKDKVREFEKIYEQPPVIGFHNISFYKVNSIMHTYPSSLKFDERNLKIVVSHYPVTSRHVFAQEVIKEINPDIFFCAHDHDSKYVKQNTELKQLEKSKLGQEVLKVQFSDDALYEVYVPTCSYRMGTSSMGYGAAVLENNNQQMRYTVFWSPMRFPYLVFYLALLIVFILYFLVFCAAKLVFRQSKALGKSGDLSPLLQRI